MTWVIDRDQVIVITVVLAVTGIAATALVGWLAARRSVRPLADALRRQRDFVADASHELRTPLTVLNTRAQLLEHRQSHHEPVEATVVQLRADIATMNNVLDDMLSSVEVDAAASTSTSVAMSALAAVDSMRVLADEAGVAVWLQGGDGVQVAVPATRLTRCFVALIDNAIHHSPKDSTVQVTITSTPTTVVIDVSDEGSGIHGVDPVRIFDRFAHSTSGRRRGFGLGLALVRDITDRAHGSVRVASTSNSGTTIRLTLPRLRADQASS